MNIKINNFISENSEIYMNENEYFTPNLENLRNINKLDYIVIDHNKEGIRKKLYVIGLRNFIQIQKSYRTNLKKTELLARGGLDPEIIYKNTYISTLTPRVIPGRPVRGKIEYDDRIGDKELNSVMRMLIGESIVYMEEIDEIINFFSRSKELYRQFRDIMSGFIIMMGSNFNDKIEERIINSRGVQRNKEEYRTTEWTEKKKNKCDKYEVMEGEKMEYEILPEMPKVIQGMLGDIQSINYVHPYYYNLLVLIKDNVRLRNMLYLFYNNCDIPKLSEILMKEREELNKEDRIVLGVLLSTEDIFYNKYFNVRNKVSMNKIRVTGVNVMTKEYNKYWRNMYKDNSVIPEKEYELEIDEEIEIGSIEPIIYSSNEKEEEPYIITDEDGLLIIGNDKLINGVLNKENLVKYGRLYTLNDDVSNSPDGLNKFYKRVLVNNKKMTIGQLSSSNRERMWKKTFRGKNRLRVVDFKLKVLGLTNFFKIRELETTGGRGIGSSVIYPSSSSSSSSSSLSPTTGASGGPAGGGGRRLPGITYGGNRRELKKKVLYKIKQKKTI